MKKLMTTEAKFKIGDKILTDLSNVIKLLEVLPDHEEMKNNTLDVYNKVFFNYAQPYYIKYK
jgi:hypothetical protein